MEDFLILEGTKREMAEQLAKELNISKEKASTEAWGKMLSLFVDYLAKDQGRILAEDEMFFINQPPKNQAWNEWVTGSADYYISIKKMTFLILMGTIEGVAEMQGLNPIVGRLIFSVIEKMTENNEALMAPLDQAAGESCIVLEALRQRKKGINAAWFRRYRQECFENTLKCNKRQEGKCKLKEAELSEMLKSLTERGVLIKSGKNFFYKDWF